MVEENSGQWQSFAMRPNTTSPEGRVPSVGDLYTCPDIITLQDPVFGPQEVFSTAESWSANYSTVWGNRPNYIYVRAKNWAQQHDVATVQMYQTPASLINWPGDWLLPEKRLSTADGARLVRLEADAQEIAVGDQPFVFTAPSPNPGDHDCLFALVDSYLAPNQLLHKDVPQTYKTIAELVTNKLYIGWKNMARVVVDEPDTLYSIRLFVPPQSTRGDLLRVYFVATRGLVGSSVQITSGDSVGYKPVINIKKLKIEDQNSHGQLTAPTSHGACFTMLNVQFWKEDGHPQPDDTLTIAASWVPPTMELAQPFIDRGQALRLPQTELATLSGLRTESGRSDGDNTAWEVPIGTMQFCFG